MTIPTVLLSDFITGPIPRSAWGLPPRREQDERDERPKPKTFIVEGEPLLVNAIMRELRERVPVLAEAEYPAAAGWIGKQVEYVDQ